MISSTSVLTGTPLCICAARSKSSASVGPRCSNVAYSRKAVSRGPVPTRNSLLLRKLEASCDRVVPPARAATRVFGGNKEALSRSVRAGHAEALRGRRQTELRIEVKLPRIDGDLCGELCCSDEHEHSGGQRQGVFRISCNFQICPPKANLQGSPEAMPTYPSPSRSKSGECSYGFPFPPKGPRGEAAVIRCGYFPSKCC